MKGGLGQAPERDIAVYLGLAATAFLLVMLHPSKEEESPSSPAAVHPILQAGVQVGLSLAACMGLQQLKRGSAGAVSSWPLPAVPSASLWGAAQLCGPPVYSRPLQGMRKQAQCASWRLTCAPYRSELRGAGSVCQGVRTAAWLHLSSASAHGGRKHGRWADSAQCV